MDSASRHFSGYRLSGRVFHLSLLEAWRNKMGLLLFFGIPVVFLTIVQITAGTGYISVNLFYPEETYRPLLIIRNVCMAFGATGVCAFLSAYYSLLLFHRDFDYFRHCVFAGLKPLHFMIGRFGFLLVLIMLLAAGTTVLEGSLVDLNRPADAFIGFIFIGVVYGALGAIFGMLVKDFLIGFLIVAVLTDIDPAWLQNPVYYTAGQNTEIIKWLPAFYPSQYIFSASFMTDNNPLACRGSIIYGVALLVILFVIIAFRLGHLGRTPAPVSLSQDKRSQLGTEGI
jgi:hypothetical protein